MLVTSLIMHIFLCITLGYISQLLLNFFQIFLNCCRILTFSKLPLNFSKLLLVFESFLSCLFVTPSLVVFTHGKLPMLVYMSPKHEQFAFQLQKNLINDIDNHKRASLPFYSNSKILLWSK